MRIDTFEPPMEEISSILRFFTSRSLRLLRKSPILKLLQGYVLRHMKEATFSSLSQNYGQFSGNPLWRLYFL